MIQPLGNRVVIRRDEPDEHEGGVFLPGVYPQRGTVIAAGPLAEVKPGDIVLYSKYLCPVVTERRSGIRADGQHSLSPHDELLLIDGDRLIVAAVAD